VEKAVVPRDGNDAVVEVTYNPQMARMAEDGDELLLLPIDPALGSAYEFVGVAQNGEGELSEEWTWRKDWLTELREAEVPLSDARFAVALRWQTLASQVRGGGGKKRTLMDIIKDMTAKEGE
jgi:hypothetical protein